MRETGTVKKRSALLGKTGAHPTRNFQYFILSHTHNFSISHYTVFIAPRVRLIESSFAATASIYTYARPAPTSDEITGASEAKRRDFITSLFIRGNKKFPYILIGTICSKVGLFWYFLFLSRILKPKKSGTNCSLFGTNCSKNSKYYLELFVPFLEQFVPTQFLYLTWNNLFRKWNKLFQIRNKLFQPYQKPKLFIILVLLGTICSNSGTFCSLFGTICSTLICFSKNSYSPKPVSYAKPLSTKSLSPSSTCLRTPLLFGTPCQVAKAAGLSVH